MPPDLFIMFGLMSQLEIAIALRFLRLLLFVIPLSQTNLTAQLPPLCEPLLLHLPRNLNQLVKIPVAFPNELPFSSPLLDHLIRGKVTLYDELAIDRDFRAGDRIHEGVDELQENR